MCLIAGTLPYFTVGLAKDSLAYVPFFGWILWASGSVFVNRKNHTNAVESCNRLASQLKEDPKKYVIPRLLMFVAPWVWPSLSLGQPNTDTEAPQVRKCMKPPQRSGTSSRFPGA